jgi:plasmid stabilization system protein ParE
MARWSRFALNDLENIFQYIAKKIFILAIFLTWREVKDDNITRNIFLSS